MDRPPGCSLRAIARQYGVSPDTVSRYARQMLEECLRGFDRYDRVAVYVCEGCGHRITIRPCVICAAAEHRTRNVK